MTKKTRSSFSANDNNKHGSLSLEGKTPIIYNGTAQLLSEVTVKKTVINDTDVYLKTQLSQDNYLILNPNNVFFENEAGFTCTDDAGDGSTLPDADMAQNKNYQSLTGWKTLQARLNWPVYFAQAGTVELWVTLIADSTNVDESGNGATIEIILENYLTGEKQIYISVVKENSEAVHQQQWKVSMPVQEAGIHYISMRASSMPRTEVGIFKQILLTGYSVIGSELIRARWRPAAVHSSFRSTTIPEGEEAILWVVETTQYPGPGGSYSPVTTPFGYIGSSRKKTTGLPTSFNFSVWAFDADEAPIDFIQMPHITAIGNSTAAPSWYGHEGTGVKIRDWDPYADATIATQTIAYSITKGDPTLEPGSEGYYDVYTTYFYSPEQDQWHLYGQCKDTPIENLNTNTTTGSFVEVPGAADKERTGDIVRKVDFKGWVYATDQQWHKIDNFLAIGDKGTTESPLNKAWTMSAAGNAFELSLTGIEHYPYTKEDNIFALSAPAELPAHLEGKTSDDFLPVTIDLSLRNPEQMIFCDSAVIIFNFVGLDDQAEVTLYWGTEDRLTYLETITGATSIAEYTYPAWDKSIPVSVKEGINYVILSGLESGGAYYYRMHGKNISGQVFSDRTGKITRLAKGEETHSVPLTGDI